MRLVKWKPSSYWPTILDNDDFWNWPSISEDTGLNVYETDSNIIVEAAVPGVFEDEVEVTVEGNVLCISARHEETEEEKKEKKTMYKSSRRSSFNYSTSLPRIVDPQDAEAEVENGVVKITIPKTEEDKPKRIEVRKK